jgi:sodium transport system permease protein
MRARIVRDIYLKEIRETLRDRRTLIMMVGLPLILYPLIILGMSSLRQSESLASEARQSRVAVWGDFPAELDALARKENIQFLPGTGMPAQVRGALGTYKPYPETPPAREGRKKEKKDNTAERHPLTQAARPLVIGRRVDAVLAIWPGLESQMKEGGLGNIAILYDSVRNDSRKARERLNAALTEYRKQVIARRESSRGLVPGFSRAIDIRAQNVAPESRQAGFGLGQILPMLLITISFSAAFYSAVDTTAGEKERGTLQTLLCAPLLPIEIILGKFLSVWTVTAIASGVNIASMAATFGRVAVEFGGTPIPAKVYGLAFLMLLPITLMVTAIFLAVAVFARDFKDGQNLLTPVLMVIIAISTVSVTPGMELNAWNAFAPVLNISLLIKSLFLGEISADLVFLSLLASVIYAGSALLFAARIFEREAVLLGGKDSLRGIMGLDSTGPRAATPSLALAVFAIVLVTAFYGSLALRGAGMATMLLTIQYGFFLMPVLAVVAGFRLPWNETLLLNLPRFPAIAGSAIAGISLWAFVIGLAFRILPPPESLVKALEKLLLWEGTQPPLWFLIFCVAVTPAICEELLFRGLILSGLRPLGMWPAIAISSLLFGLAHASVYRFLPTFMLGFAMGYAAWKTGSIVPGMIIHAFNNGLAAVLAQKVPASKSVETSMPLEWTLAGGLVAALGIWLISKSSTAQPQH